MQNLSKKYYTLVIDKTKQTYTTLTNFSTNYPLMCKVFTDAGGLIELYHGCPPVWEIIST